MWPWFLGFRPFPLIDRFYQNLWIQESEAQKQRLHKLLGMLRFDKKSISNGQAQAVLCLGGYTNIRPASKQQDLTSLVLILSFVLNFHLLNLLNH